VAHPAPPSFDEPKKMPHKIEVTLKTPEWLQLENKLEDMKTINGAAFP
jgi:hypothetical protein